MEHRTRRSIRVGIQTWGTAIVAAILGTAAWQFTGYEGSMIIVGVLTVLGLHYSATPFDNEIKR